MRPRYEFRVFRDHLAAEHGLLEGSATREGEDEPRTDTYLVVPARVDASLKLRGAKLDLKVLREQEGGPELWQPAGEAEFPVLATRLRYKFLDPAGVRLDLPEAPIGRDVLLALARAAPATRVVRVEKHRRRYRLGGAAAEFTRLSVDGQPVESVAVEDADRQRTIASVDALGLTGRRNTSYQRFLVERFVSATTRGAAGT